MCAGRERRTRKKCHQRLKVCPLGQKRPIQNWTEKKKALFDCLVVCSLVNLVVRFLCYVFLRHWRFRSRDWLIDLTFVGSRVCWWRWFILWFTWCVCAFVRVMYLDVRKTIQYDMNRDTTFRHVTKLRPRSGDPSASYFIDGVCSCLWPRRWRVSSEQRHVICRLPVQIVIREKFRVWDVTSPCAIPKYLYFKKMKTTWSSDTDIASVKTVYAVSSWDQWKFCMCHKRLCECHATNIHQCFPWRRHSHADLGVPSSPSFDTKSFHDHYCAQEQDHFGRIDTGFHERFLSYSSSQVQFTIFRAQTFILWQKKIHQLRVSFRVSLESANDKVFTSIAHVFVTTNMSVSFHVQWFNAGQRRRSRVIRELHVRCPCVLSTSFFRGVNWSSCSTGFVLVCRELVVTVSLCVYMFVFLVISVENWSWTQYSLDIRNDVSICCFFFIRNFKKMQDVHFFQDRILSHRNLSKKLINAITYDEVSITKKWVQKRHWHVRHWLFQAQECTCENDVPHRDASNNMTESTSLKFIILDMT